MGITIKRTGRPDQKRASKQTRQLCFRNKYGDYTDKDHSLTHVLGTK